MYHITKNTKAISESNSFEEYANKYTIDIETSGLLESLKKFRESIDDAYDANISLAQYIKSLSI